MALLHAEVEKRRLPDKAVIEKPIPDRAELLRRHTEIVAANEVTVAQHEQRQAERQKAQNAGHERVLNAPGRQEFLETQAAKK